MVKKVCQLAFWYGAMLIISRHLSLPMSDLGLIEACSRWQRPPFLWAHHTAELK